MKKFAPADVKVKVELKLFNDRTFEMTIISPKTANLILRKLGIKLGSGEPNKKKIGSITEADLVEIAELKRGDMNTDNLESMIASIRGTAKNME